MTDSSIDQNVNANNQWKSALVWLGAGVFVLSLGFASYFVVKSSFTSIKEAHELDWRQLGEYDYITGQGPEVLMGLNGKMVKMPGFMVPLEDNQKSVTEFLLVPSPQACVHVPPPPPNQMILVKMDKSKQTDAAYGPIWVYGELKIGSERHLYGESSFVMSGVLIEPYEL